MLLGMLSGSAAAATAEEQFPADSTLMRGAFWAATVHWAAVPCGGQVQLVWADLNEGENAMATWEAFGATPFSMPSTNRNCRIEFNRRQAYDWPMLCTVAVHEVGHLLGHEHDNKPGNVMSTHYSGELPLCTDLARKGGLIQPPPAIQAVARKTKRKGKRRTLAAKHRPARGRRWSSAALHS